MNPITIQNELIRMPEWERIANIRQFSLSVQIFQTNAAELIGLLSQYETGPNALNLWSIENRYFLEQIQIEIARLLHNFVAASLSLVDHSRRFYKLNYKTTEQFRDYETEVSKRFQEDPLCQFVQGLRNYYIHKQVPKLTTTLDWRAGQDISNSTLLDKTSLMDFEWSANARQYLEATPEIDLLKLVSEYTRKVTDFYLWMFARLEEIHAADLNAVKIKQLELRKAIGLTIPGKLETSLKISNQIRTAPEQFFVSLLDNKTWHKICASNNDPTQRANALLDAVEEYSPPLGSLRQRIVDLFIRFYSSHEESQPSGG